MDAERWTRRFSVAGQEFEAHFLRRPFREGLEVAVMVRDEVLRIAEFGFGEQALLEKLSHEITRRLAEQPTSDESGEDR